MIALIKKFYKVKLTNTYIAVYGQAKATNSSQHINFTIFILIFKHTLKNIKRNRNMACKMKLCRYIILLTE